MQAADKQARTARRSGKGGAPARESAIRARSAPAGVPNATTREGFGGFRGMFVFMMANAGRVQKASLSDTDHYGPHANPSPRRFWEKGECNLRRDNAISAEIGLNSYDTGYYGAEASARFASREEFGKEKAGAAASMTSSPTDFIITDSINAHAHPNSIIIAAAVTPESLHNSDTIAPVTKPAGTILRFCDF